MSETIQHHRGRFLAMVEHDHWEYVTRVNASAVVVLVAKTEQNELVLVEQPRKPIRGRTIELPAGLVGDEDDADESILDAANRELEEETGFTASQLEIHLQCPTSAGMTDETITFVRAHGLRRVGPGGGVGNEDITVHCVALTEIDDWLDQQNAAGKALDPKIYSALYWLEKESP